jgi:hypothetical protein
MQRGYGWVFFFLSLKAFAGGEVGNGGNTVVCFGVFDTISSTELLDYYQYADTLPYDLGPAFTNFNDKVKFVLNRLSRLDPERAKNYQIEASQFVQVTRWVNGSIPQVPDSGFVPVPKDCSIEQTAIQYPANRSDGTRYTVTDDIWDRLDENNKAGLILHEIVYREEIRLGYTDSEKARYYNAVISSDQINTMDQNTYNNFSSITFEPVQGVSFNQEDITLSASGNATSSINMNTYLAYAGTEPLSWYLVPDPAKGIAIDINTGVLTITGATGTYNYMLVVREGGEDGQHAATANLSIEIH